VSHQRRRNKRGTTNTWVGRTLGRDIPCHKCGATIPSGYQGFTRASQVDYCEWHCETCVT